MENNRIKEIMNDTADNESILTQKTPTKVIALKNALLLYKKKKETQAFFHFYSLMASHLKDLEAWVAPQNIKENYWLDIISTLNIDTNKIWNHSERERYKDLRLISYVYGEEENCLGIHIAQVIEYLLLQNYTLALKALYENNLTTPCIHSSDFSMIDFQILQIIEKSVLPLEKDSAFLYCVEKKILTSFDFKKPEEEQFEDHNLLSRYDNLITVISRVLDLYNPYKNFYFSSDREEKRQKFLLKEPLIYTKILYWIKANCDSKEQYQQVLGQLSAFSQNIKASLEKYDLQTKLSEDISHMPLAGKNKIHKI